MPEGVWTPGAGASFTYPLSAQSVTITVEALLSFTPNLASAGYFIYDSISGTTQNYAAAAQTTSGGARITGANIPFINSGQEIWFYISSASGTTDYSPHYKMYRITSLYLPMITKPGLLESNNTACDATVAAKNANYIGQNDDQNDWFKLSVDSYSVISISLSGFETLAYMELRSGSDCNNTQIAQIASLPAPENPVITQNVLAGGDYYARILGNSPDGKTYTFSWTSSPLLGELEPNNTACEATLANSGQNYTGRDDDQYDWFSVAFTTTGTANITVTGFSGTGYLQLFSATNGDCGQVGATSVATVTLGSGATTLNSLVGAGAYYARIVSTGAKSNATYTFAYRLDTSASGVEFEPNNTACAATPINLENVVRTFANDAEDWFYMDNPTTGTLQIAVTNMPTETVSEFYFYRANTDCNNLVQVDSANQINTRSARAGSYWLFGMVDLAPGRYYLRVRALSGFNATQPYQFIASRNNLGVWGPKFQLCKTQESYNGCNNFTNGTVTLYWFGLSGATTLWFYLDGREGCGLNCGCPAGAILGTVTISNPGEKGSYTFTNINRAFYKIYVRVDSPNRAQYQDEKPIKMDCEFLNGFEPVMVYPGYANAR